VPSLPDFMKQQAAGAAAHAGTPAPPDLGTPALQVGLGRIVVSEIEAPILFVNPVNSGRAMQRCGRPLRTCRASGPTA
jgi:hypothetical protein